MDERCAEELEGSIAVAGGELSVGRGIKWLLPQVVAVCLAGCAASQPATRRAQVAQPSEADRIVAAWSAAQGTDRLGKVRNIRVHLDGSWSRLAIAFDPVLTDSEFRISSDERYQIRPPVSDQAYRGPSGSKLVIRDNQATHVLYNDRETQDANVKDAAALVADCYRMFLLGPIFFDEHHGQFRSLGTRQIGGADCDELSADIKPGLGNSGADSVELSIDRQRHLLVRIRMSPTGWPNTRGKTADVYLQDPVTIGGITFPSSFREQMEGPIPITLHEWKLSKFEIDDASL